MFSRIQNILSGNVLDILYTLPAILIGLTVHEWAHAFAAYKIGDPTARNLGRMTLNPIAHIDLFGFLCLLLTGFGWAKPVPINPRNFKDYKRDEILVSLAGICTNLLTAFLFILLFYIGMYKLNLYDNAAFVNIFYAVVIVNLSLAVFNLLPLYPLDGSHVFECLLGHRMPRLFQFLHQYGQYILIILLITGLVGNLLGTVVSWLFNGFSAAALAVIGLF